MRTLEAGQVIPEWSLPMTPTTIVSTAIAFTGEIRNGRSAMATSPLPNPTSPRTKFAKAMTTAAATHSALIYPRLRRGETLGDRSPSAVRRLSLWLLDFDDVVAKLRFGRHEDHLRIRS